MTDWNFADVWELAARIRGDRRALVHGGRRVSWTQFDRRAAGLASRFVAAGLERDAKVAQYLYNCNEYLESLFAAFKVSMVPVNTNYRYGADELTYLWDNADVEAVVFHEGFLPLVKEVRPRVPRVRLWLCAAESASGELAVELPDWAEPYEPAATSLGERSSTHLESPGGRSGDDLYLLYTGGTTGMPKGVMWRQDDLFVLLNGGSPVPMPDDAGLEGITSFLEALNESPPSVLPACPLMHGTGAFTAFSSLILGGAVVTLTGRGFDPVALLDLAEQEKVNLITIVGDAFAKPILRALDAAPGRWDLSNLVGMISSGVIWSEETKRGLLRHNPNMTLVDAFSSSEALGMGSSISTAGAAAGTARFSLGEHAKVIDEEGREIPPGSGRAGRLALGGRLPLGYYKDEEKTAATFVVIEGQRYSVPGDYALVEPDGSLQLLGRGSVSINTGGEKVFPEEVEEALKTYPGVRDAAVVGVPDERFGQAITALVQLAPGVQASPGELIEHVKAHLAGYKAPRHLLFVESVGRSPAGKVDYESLTATARSRLGPPS